MCLICSKNHDSLEVEDVEDDESRLTMQGSLRINKIGIRLDKKSDVGCDIELVVLFALSPIVHSIFKI